MGLFYAEHTAPYSSKEGTGQAQCSGARAWNKVGGRGHLVQQEQVVIHELTGSLGIECSSEVTGNRRKRVNRVDLHLQGGNDGMGSFIWQGYIERKQKCRILVVKQCHLASFRTRFCLLIKLNVESLR